MSPIPQIQTVGSTQEAEHWDDTKESPLLQSFGSRSAIILPVGWATAAVVAAPDLGHCGHVDTSMNATGIAPRLLAGSGLAPSRPQTLPRAIADDSGMLWKYGVFLACLGQCLHEPMGINPVPSFTSRYPPLRSWSKASGHNRVHL